MKRFSLIVASVLAAALFTSLLTAPLQAQGTGPKPPITDPQLGKPKKDTQTATADTGTNAAEPADTNAGTGADTAAAANAIKTLADVKACLANGQTVYGVTSNTTNVRSAPSTDACRYGKLAKGTMVAIADYQVSKPKPLAMAQPTHRRNSRSRADGRLCRRHSADVCAQLLGLPQCSSQDHGLADHGFTLR